MQYCIAMQLTEEIQKTSMSKLRRAFSNSTLLSEERRRNRLSTIGKVPHFALLNIISCTILRGFQLMTSLALNTANYIV